MFAIIGIMMYKNRFGFCDLPDSYGISKKQVN